MKKIIVLILLSLVNYYSYAQGEGVKEITKDEADKIENKVNKGIDFGISLGFNSVFENLYDARISPLDNKLKVTDVRKSSFLISTGLSVPLTKGGLGGRYYRKLDSSGKPTGSVYYVPFGFCFIATVNLVTFNSAGTGSIFNQKIDGGLGLGYRINDNFQLALTYEMLSIRQPRQFLMDNYREQELKTPDGSLISSINPDDNNYFTDKYIPSLSFKFFYLIAYKPVQ